MFALKFLTGQNMGEVINLEEGSFIFGRAEGCDIVLKNPNVSKEHAVLKVEGNVVYLKDLGSTNGSFVNGRQVQVAKVYPGDKISLYDTVIEFKKNQKGLSIFNNDSIDLEGASVTLGSPSLEEPLRQRNKITEFFEDVVLPGVYQLGHYMEMKWAIAIILGLCIFVTTLFSVIPLTRILKEEVMKESQSKAVSVAQNLALINRNQVVKKQYSIISLSSAQKQEGIQRALIINQAGSVIAPTHRSGQYPDIPFIHQARKKIHREFHVGQVSDSQIVAMYPIKSFNHRLGADETLAYSVVVYNFGHRGLDSQKMISLFFQTLLMGLLIGLIGFYFIYRLTRYPVDIMNKDLAQALKSDSTFETDSEFQLINYSELRSKINSALYRSGNETEDGIMQEHDRHFEKQNLIEILGFPSLIIDGETQVLEFCNDYFAEKTGLMDFLNSPLAELSDQSLRLSIQDLIQKGMESPDELHANDLEFGGEPHQVVVQTIYGSKSIAYFVVSIVPVES